MGNSAWADYLDARLRLVHEWAGDGLPWEDMVDRLTPERHQLMLLLLTPLTPAPGTSRDQVIQLRLRVERLEHALRAAQEAPPPRVAPPTHSELRALLCQPDPDQCGCQYWADKPTPGQHHAQCAYAPKAKG